MEKAEKYSLIYFILNYSANQKFALPDKNTPLPLEPQDISGCQDPIPVFAISF
jgi:hypothetical protein